MHILLQDLNPEQQAAVSISDHNALILAGAGSGKTRVLAHRIAWLYQNCSISPLNMLAVTFTNKAAKEMRQRVESILGFSTRGLWIGTFHGISHRLLRQHATEIKLDRHFTVLDQDDQYQLIKKVLKSLNYDEKYYPPRLIQSIINGKKDEGLRPEDLIESDFDAHYLKIYKAYELKRKADNTLDFADLLLASFELLRDNEILRAHYQNRFKHILVDEFQDTNHIQYQWLKLLVSNDNHIMAVGDDDQSIYGWRGAKIENIQHFIDDLAPVEIIRLEQNYRSSKTILDAANAVIAHNEDRLGKTLWSDKKQGNQISLFEAFNERNEAEFITDRILTLKADGKKLKDIAILYRSNAQSRVLEEALLSASLPYRIYGGLRFFERAEIKDALAYLRLINDNADNMAFERIINTPARGIGLKSVDVIREHANLHNLTMWQAANELISQKRPSARAAGAIARFIELIDGFSTLKDELTLSQLTRMIIDTSGLFAMYEQDRSEKARQKLDNLKELVNAASEFIPPVEDVAKEDLMAEFLTFAVLESGELQADEHSDAVQMMTIHSAKGLEFSHVFISGLEEGIFPSIRSHDSKEKLAEERRLCYVGITRAMESLSLSFAKVRHQYGDVHYQLKSRFIAEIPKHYISEVRQSNKKAAKPGFGISPFEFIEQKSNASKFKQGEFVSHPKFGIGVFIKAEGVNDEMCYHVDFKASRGIKVLLAKLCQLSKL